MPRGIPNSRIEAAEQPIGQQPSVDIPVSAKLDTISRPDLKLESENIVVASTGLDNSYAAQLAFMEEHMEVMVHESTDKNAEPIVQVACNGINQFFPRGVPVTCRRKFVEILARAKITSIETQTVNTDRDVINRINKTTALRYPFSIVSDPNPQGAAWLRSVLSAA